MTTSGARELGKRRDRLPGAPAAGEPKTFVADFGMTFIPRIHAAAGIQFPSPHYQQDPVAFCREILGFEPWARQIEMLEAVRDHKRVAIKSGHKVSKSRTAGSLALWFYCSFDHARVVLTSTTSRQVDAILWREVRMLRAEAGKCVDCKRREKEAKARGERLVIPKPCPHSSLIDGELAETARSGLKSDDFREIVGFTAKQGEAVAGVSGVNVLYIPDEASGIPDKIFEAIEGNRAGNARVAMFSNPTQNAGTFYDAFNTKARFFKTLTISSEESPNVVAGYDVIPGLASKEWLDEKREEWGENSSLWKIRVKGDFAEHEQGKIFSVHTIAEAERRWNDTPSEGRLYIGLDPAGEKGTGDEICFFVRRGLKAIKSSIHRGLTEDGHLIQLLVLIGQHKQPRETPVVVVDSDGSVGSKVYLAIRNYSDEHPGEMEVVRVRGSDKSQRQPELYPSMRDALTASLAAWFDAGGAIPEDTKLEKELHSMEWKQRADGKQKVTPKDQLRKTLGRSPDRYDALALATWEPLSLRMETSLHEALLAAKKLAADPYSRGGAMDPYAASKSWERR
jgi:hypothetical protein